MLLKLRSSADSIPSALTIFSITCIDPPSIPFGTFLVLWLFLWLLLRQILLLIQSIDDDFDLRRFRMQIAHRRRETFVPHDFLHQSRIFCLCHGDRAERVPGAIELQGIRNSELASNASEHVL